MIVAVCANIAAILASASGGEVIQLTGVCPAIKITKVYKTRVFVQAQQATVKGLAITGGNITWQGGVIQASGGSYSSGSEGYGVYLRNAVNANIEYVRITSAKKGIVLDNASGIVIMSNVFERLGEDGIIATASKNISVVGNQFQNTEAKATVCSLLSGQVSGLSQRDCAARGGKWTDGYHPDAFQMRNGMSQVVVANNIVSGPTQGITQMDTTGDKPLDHVYIRGNSVQTSAGHPITFGNCISCEITTNTVSRAPGSTVKTQIIPGLAMACGNKVQDVQVGTAPCKTTPGGRT